MAKKLKTIRELAENCNPEEIIGKLYICHGNRKSVDDLVIKLYYSIYRMLKEEEPGRPVPGHERIIVDVVPEKLWGDKVHFFIMYSEDAGIRDISLLDRDSHFSEDLDVRNLYVSSTVLKHLGCQALLREVLFVLCRDSIMEIQEEYRVLERIKHVSHADPEDNDRKRRKNEEVLSDTSWEEAHRNHYLLRSPYVYRERRRFDKRMLQRERQEAFGQIYYWNDILQYAKMDSKKEQYGRKLLPHNPPSALEMERQIWEMKKMLKRNADKYNCGKIIMTDKASIIIEPYSSRKGELPLVYVQGEEDKKEIQSVSIREFLKMPIVVKDKTLYHKDDRILFILLLYYTYPLRMKREMRRRFMAMLTNALQQTI